MKNIEQYLQEYIDESAKVEKEYNLKGLSFAIQSNYLFYHARLLEYEMILVYPREEIGTEILEKQFKTMFEKLEKPIVLVAGELTGYKKKKLIEKRIPFILISKEIYIPFMFMNIKMQREKVYTGSKKFSPTTQLVFLYCLYYEQDNIQQRELANRLKMTSMSVSRAINELVQKNLINLKKIEGEGNKKIYQILDKVDYYQQGKEYLINPILKTVYFEEIPTEMFTLKAGLEALEVDTMLAPPNRQIKATTKEVYMKFKSYEVTSGIAKEDKAYVEVQIMKYDLFTVEDNGKVDALTMLLSLEEKDERIEQAIEQKMEAYDWYMA